MEPTRGSVFSPETCHSQVVHDKIFERVGEVNYWPTAALGSAEILGTADAAERTLKDASRRVRTLPSIEVDNVQWAIASSRH